MKCLAFSNERENANVIIKFECKLVVCMSVYQYVCLSQSVWGEICICIFIHIFFIIARAKLRSVETNTNGQRNCNLIVAIYNHIWIDRGREDFRWGNSAHTSKPQLCNGCLRYVGPERIHEPPIANERTNRMLLTKAIIFPSFHLRQSV